MPFFFHGTVHFQACKPGIQADRLFCFHQLLAISQYWKCSTFHCIIADFTSFQLTSAPNNAFSYNEVCEDLARWNFPRSFFFLLPSLTTHFQVCTCAPKHVQILAVALDNWWHTLIWGMLVPLGPKLSDNEDRVYEHINELIKPNLKIRQRKRMNENKRM